MKDITASFQSHIQSEVTTLAGCCQISRTDGQNFYFTDHDNDIVYDSNTYISGLGVMRSDVSSRSDLSVNDLDISGFIDSSYITEEDLEAGLYNGAEVKFFTINWNDPSMGILKFSRGWVGSIDLQDGIYIAQFSGLTQALQNNVLELVTPECQAEFGDSRCGYDKTSTQQTGTVETVTSNRIFTTSFSHSSENQFQQGEVTFNSGNNQNLVIEVKQSTLVSKQITLFLSAPFSISIGDSITLSQGCLKTPDNCKSYGNYARYQGFPDVIGEDELVRIKVMY